MTALLLIAAKLLIGVVLFDGLIVGFLCLFTLGDRLRTDRLNDWVEWEAEFRSSRETATRQHPAGGSR